MSAVRYSAMAKANALHEVRAMQDRGYSRRGAVQQVAAQLGCRSETLNAWLRRDASRQRHHPLLGQDARVDRLEREVRQLTRANANLRLALAQLERRAREMQATSAPAAPSPRQG
jgi:transposase-like protein